MYVPRKFAGAGGWQRFRSWFYAPSSDGLSDKKPVGDFEASGQCLADFCILGQSGRKPPESRPPGSGTAAPGGYPPPSGLLKGRDRWLLDSARVRSVRDDVLATPLSSVRIPGSCHVKDSWAA